jgi:multidrug efflux system membrane fusion protein
MKKILFPSLFALAAAILTGGCSRSAITGAGAGAPVLVAKAIATNVPVQIQPQPVGHVMPFSSVAIRPQVGGILQQVHFKEGQEAKKGD